jgi:ribosomal subunit interface protein
MQTNITVRHCEIPDALRERAISVVARLGNLAPRPMDTTVVFDIEGTQRTAELRLHIARGEVLVATGRAPDHRTALDRAEEKLRRQLERASDRPRRVRSNETDQPL